MAQEVKNDDAVTVRVPSALLQKLLSPKVVIGAGMAYIGLAPFLGPTLANMVTKQDVNVEAPQIEAVVKKELEPLTEAYLNAQNALTLHVEREWPAHPGGDAAVEEITGQLTELQGQLVEFAKRQEATDIQALEMREDIIDTNKQLIGLSQESVNLQRTLVGVLEANRTSADAPGGQ